MKSFNLFIILAALLIQTNPLNAQEEQIARGKSIATQLCSKCHAVSTTDKSTHEKAPPFRTFAAKWPLESLEEALAEGIVTGHTDMPEFKLQPEDIGAFIMYLKTL